MPVKGWVNYTVREETAKIINDYAEKHGKSASEVISLVAQNLEKYRALQVIKEEALKAHLASALEEIERFLSFCKALLAPERGVLTKTEYLTFAHIEVLFQDRPKSLGTIGEVGREARIERDKLRAILRRLGHEANPPPSFPLVPLSGLETKVGKAKLMAPPLLALREFTDVHFAEGQAFRNNADNLEAFAQAIPELRLTISVLDKLADWIVCFLNDLDVLLKRSHEPPR